MQRSVRIHIGMRLIRVTYVQIGLSQPLDGDLALLDPFADEQLECFRANCQTLTASLNGRLLAGGGANGIIHVYEFDTLKLLYQVRSTSSYIKQLAFTRDSMRLADIRGTQCNVWEPEALLRDFLSDDSSGSTLTSVVETVSIENKVMITAMVAHHGSEVIFCGRSDGSIVLYERKTAGRLGMLHSHKSPVRLLTWIEDRNTLLSIDASNGIFAHEIVKSAGRDWLDDMKALFTSRLDSEMAIINVLVGERAAKFLVSTRESDHLFNLDTGHCEDERSYPPSTGVRKWLPHPQIPLHLLCVDNFKLCTYNWSDWSAPSSINSLPEGETAVLKGAIVYSLDQKPKIQLDFTHSNGTLNTYKNMILIVDADNMPVENKDNPVFLGGGDRMPWRRWIPLPMLKTGREWSRRQALLLRFIRGCGSLNWPFPRLSGLTKLRRNLFF